MSTSDEAAIFVDQHNGTTASQASSAFHAWKYLVTKYIALTSEESKERIEYLMKPLQTFNSQTSEMCTIKFKIWWDLIVALESHIEKFSFSIIYNFLNFCFGSVSQDCEHCDSFPPNICKTHCSVGCNPALNFTVESLKETSCIDVKYLSNALAQLLCLKCEPPSKRHLLRQLRTPVISLPVHFQAMSKLLLHCVGKCTVLIVNGQYDPKFKMYSLRKIWINLMNQIKRIENIPSSTSQNLPKAFKHCAKTEVFKNVFCILSKLCEISTENENLVNSCLSPVLETVLSKKNGLSKEILTSEIYYWGPGDPRSPLYTMLNILLSPSFVGIKNHEHEALFMTLLNRLFELGIGPANSTVSFVQEVIKKLDMALNSGTTIHPKILITTWNIIAKKLTICMKSRQTINQGNENQVDFKHIYLILIFPVSNIEFFIFDHESIYRSWRQLFDAFQKNCILCSIVENDVYDNIFRLLFQEVEIMNDMNYDEMLFVTNLVTTVLERVPFQVVNNIHSTSTAWTYSASLHQSLKLLHVLSSKTTNLTGRNDIYFKIMSLFAKCSTMFCNHLQVCVSREFILSLEDFINFLLNVNMNHSEALQYYVKIMRNMWNCFLNKFVKNILSNNFHNGEDSTLQAVVQNSFSFPDHEIHIISMQFLLSENLYLSLEMNKCMLCANSFKNYNEIKSLSGNEPFNWKEVEERKKYLIQEVQHFFLHTEEMANSHENNDNEMEEVEILTREREMEQSGSPASEREMEQVEVQERENLSSRTMPEQAYPTDTSEAETDSMESTRGTAVIKDVLEDTFREVTDIGEVENVNTSGASSPEILNDAEDAPRDPDSEERSINADTLQNNKSMTPCDNSDLSTALTDYSKAENIVNEENAEQKNSHEYLTTSSLPLTHAQALSEEKEVHLDTQQNNKSLKQYEKSDLLAVLAGYSNEITENIVSEENSERNSHEKLNISIFPLTDAQDERTLRDNQQNNKSISQCDCNVTVLTDTSNEITENIVNEDNAESNSHKTLNTSLLPLSDAQYERNHLDPKKNNRSMTQCDNSDLLTDLTNGSNEITGNTVNEEKTERKNTQENLSTSLLTFTHFQTASEEKSTNQHTNHKNYSMMEASKSSDSLIVVSNNLEEITDTNVNANIVGKHSHGILTTSSVEAEHSTDKGRSSAISMRNRNQFPIVKETNESEKELMHSPDFNKQYFEHTSEAKEYEKDKGSDGRYEKYKNNSQKKKKKKNKLKKYKKKEKKSLEQKLMDTTYSTNSTSLRYSRNTPIIIRIARIKGDKNTERYYIKNLNGAEIIEQQTPSLSEDSTSSVDIRENNDLQSDICSEEPCDFDINVNEILGGKKGCSLTETGQSLMELEISDSNEAMNENNKPEENFKIAKDTESMDDHTLSNVPSSLAECLSTNSEKPNDVRSLEENGKFTQEYEKINTCLKNVEVNIPYETRMSLTTIQEHDSEETIKTVNCPEENIYTRISSENVPIFTVNESNTNEYNDQCTTYKLLPDFQENKSEKAQKNSPSFKPNLNIVLTEDGEDCIKHEASHSFKGFQESIAEKILKICNDSSNNINAIEEKLTDCNDCVGTSASLKEFQESGSNIPQENITIDDEKNQPCARFISMFKEYSDFTYKDFQKKSNCHQALKIEWSLIDFNILNTEGLQRAVRNFLTTNFECKPSLTDSHEYESDFESKSLINKRNQLKKTCPQICENKTIEISSSDSCGSKSVIIPHRGEVENKFDFNDIKYDTSININGRSTLTINVEDHPNETEIQKNSDAILKNSHECCSNALSLKDDRKVINIATQDVVKKQHTLVLNFPFDKIKEFSAKCSLSSFADSLKLFIEHEGPYNLFTGSLNSRHQGIVTDGLENISSKAEPASNSTNTLCVCPSSKSFDPEHSESNNLSSKLLNFFQQLSQLYDWKTIFKIQDNSVLALNSSPHLLINNHSNNSGMNIIFSLLKEKNQILMNLFVKNNHYDGSNISITQTYELPVGIVDTLSCLPLQACLNAKSDQLPTTSNCVEIECMHNIFKTLVSQLIMKGSSLHDSNPGDLPSTSGTSSSSFNKTIPEVFKQRSSEIKITEESENNNRKCELVDSLVNEESSNVGNVNIETDYTNMNTGIEQLTPIENLKQSIVEGPPTLQNDKNQLYAELIDTENTKYQLSSLQEPQTNFMQLLIDENNFLPIQSPDSNPKVIKNKCIKLESEVDKTKTDNSELINKSDCKEGETNRKDSLLHNVKVCCTGKHSFSSLRSNAGKVITRKLRKRKTERNIFTRKCTLECCSWMDKREGILKKTTSVKDSKVNFEKSLLISKKRISNSKLSKPNRYNVNKLNACSLINANEIYSSLVRENGISREEKRTRIFTRKKICCFLCEHPKTSKYNTVKFTLPTQDSCKNSNNKKEDAVVSNKGKALQITELELNNVQDTRKISGKQSKGEKSKQNVICDLNVSLQANTDKSSRFKNKMNCNNLHSKKRKCTAMLQDSTSMNHEQVLINKPGILKRRQKTDENACENLDYSKRLKTEITNSALACSESVPLPLESISRPTLIDYCTRKRKLHDIVLNENCVVKMSKLELKPGTYVCGKEESYIVMEMTSSVSMKVMKYDDDINLTSGPIQKNDIASSIHYFESLKKNVKDSNEPAIKEDNVFSHLSHRSKKDLCDGNDSSSIENRNGGFQGCNSCSNNNYRDHTDQLEVEWKKTANSVEAPSQLKAKRKNKRKK